MAFFSIPRVKKGTQERSYVIDNDSLDVLKRILKQLLITNTYLREVTGERFGDKDIEDKGDL